MDELLTNFTPGPILLFGSGETMPASGKAYDYLAAKLGQEPRISILETPAGFQPNSFEVSKEIADFLKRRLQNYKPEINIIPARHKNTEFSPNSREVLKPMFQSNWLMMGPGSPTYAVAQLENSLAYEYLTALHHLGAALSLASAGVLALSKYTLPVYEIYKVGLDLHWIDGLDFFNRFGLNLVFIPHWNNNDGGEKLDTSRCYIGMARFEKLVSLLSEDVVLLGIDEQTAICFDFNQPCSCEVFGKGAINVLIKGEWQVIPSGNEISLSDFGNFRIPEIKDLVPNEIIRDLEIARRGKPSKPSKEVLDLLSKRNKSREDQDWENSDRIRDELLALGWQVKDTPKGQTLESKPFKG